MSYEFLRNYRHAADRLSRRVYHFPLHAGRVLRHAPINLSIEIFDDLGTPLFPPQLRRRHLLSVVQPQRVRQFLVRVGLGLVGIRCVRRGGIRVPAPAERSDVQQIHHPLVVLFSCQLHWRRKRALVWRLCEIGVASKPPNNYYQGQDNRIGWPPNRSLAQHEFSFAAAHVSFSGHGGRK